ncbi:MAG: Gfo/Idh/MocA family oxidoreductase [Lachnospiraceae bacterium]|nr:Gfo/Idh/MocA family oxidoreductase [Lachnospiraceae bacterium]
MKFALIGCGHVSPNHIQAALNNRLDIVAICDLVPEEYLKLSGRFGLDQVPRYTDYKTMLEKERPELVAIATESGKHAGQALDCIHAGCNVIIEKPIALSAEEADAVIRAGREMGVSVCVCHQNRFNKAVGYIRRAVEEGRFGRMLHASAAVRWNRGRDYYEQKKWRGTREMDGGCLMNQCIHDIDLLLWMMRDEVVEVTAYTDRLMHPYIEAEDFGMAMLKFKSGAYGLIEGSVNVYPANLEAGLCLFGEKGTVKAGGMSVNIIEEWRFADGKDDPERVKELYSEEMPNVYGYGHTPLYADMVEAIREGRKPCVDGEAGKKAVELILAIYRSAEEGRPVKLPLKETAAADQAGGLFNGRR